MRFGPTGRPTGRCRPGSRASPCSTPSIWPNWSPCIDWTPFFQAWELAGRYPKILDDAVVGEQARQLFGDAQAMLRRIVDERWLSARAVVGLFAANAIGDDIELYTDDTRSAVLATLHHLRQQQEKPAGVPNLCLADYVAPRDSGVPD